jgi:cytidine deaminase
MFYKDYKFIEHAALEAKKSLFYNKHGTVFVSNGKIISKGYNSIRFVRKFPSRASCHAEVDAIVKWRSKRSRKKQTIDIYNARINKNGVWKESAPCKQCVSYLRETCKLRYIVYTNKEGTISKQHIRDFHTEHITHGNNII